MKYLINIKGILILILMLVLVNDIFAGDRKVNWDAFSVNLVVAMKSKNPGLQQAAMQRIIQYTDSLDITDAVYDIALIFGFHNNPKMRRLAMVTLSKINTNHSLNYLCRFLKFENNQAIRNQCCLIIRNYYVAKKPDKMDELTTILTERVRN
ncbi:MAG: hypothetical protein P8X42_03120 [Calditrichaceae bacterium]|jgi:hypothetical protein